MKKIKIIFLIVGAVIAHVVTIILFLVGVIFIIGSIKHEIRGLKDPDNYLKTDGFLSYFSSFPRDLHNISYINDYYYLDYGMRDGLILVLDASYDDVCFENEIERLNNLIIRNSLFSNERPSDYGKYKKLLYCDDGFLFEYPTYVAIYNDFGDYEYVCVDFENKRCIYVFLRYLSAKRMPLEDKYLPKNYYKNYSDDTSDNYDYFIYPLYPDVSIEDWYKDPN